MEPILLRLAIARGIRDENRLTDMIFNLRHKERAGSPIQKQETQLIAEWRAIRQDMVRPALATIPEAPPVATAPQPSSAAPAGGCRRTEHFAQSNSCRAQECRVTAGMPQALATVPKELTCYKREEKLDPAALAAYQRLYAAASKELPSPRLLKLVSGYRDYDTGARLWNDGVLSTFRMLGAQSSLPCLKTAIEVTTSTLRDVPIPHPRDLWTQRFKSELQRLGCTPDCDPAKVAWLANYHKLKTTEPVTVALWHKRISNAPPGNSPHATGRALDLWVGASASTNQKQLAILRAQPAYHWLVCNAERFGFHPYHVEPWHWEFTEG